MISVSKNVVKFPKDKLKSKIGSGKIQKWLEQKFRWTREASDEQKTYYNYTKSLMN